MIEVQASEIANTQIMLFFASKFAFVILSIAFVVISE